MPLTTLEATLLWLGIEDYTGLWEARYEVAAAHTELSPAAVNDRAVALLSGLVGRGLIQLYRCVGLLPDGMITEVSSHMLESVLMDEQSWHPPESPQAASVWYAATALGESAYRMTGDQRDE